LDIGDTLVCQFIGRPHRIYLVVMVHRIFELGTSLDEAVRLCVVLGGNAASGRTDETGGEIPSYSVFFIEPFFGFC
jgi:hypothetical protein